MQLSEYTLTVLKNFSTINSGLVIKSGNIQKTMAPDKSVLVQVEIDDSFPIEFGIYDLNQFLGNVTTMSNPELSFADKTVTMKDDLFSLVYYSCSPEVIISPPEKELVLKDPDVRFDLNNAVMTKILRLASMNNLPHLSVIGKSGELLLCSHDKSNAGSNHATTKIADHSGDDFTITFKTENLKIIPDDYSVEAKSGAFARFVSKNNKLVYFIALEAK